MIFKAYLYKAYLLQCLFVGMETMIDQGVLSEEEYRMLAVDRGDPLWYNLEKPRWEDKNNESS